MEAASARPSFRKPSNILSSKNAYFPPDLVNYVNEIQELHNRTNINESAKIEALKKLFGDERFTELLTLLNARRKIMLKEFNVLNKTNNNLTKNNKMKKIGATIDALTALVNQMKSMKKKNVPLLSTIHGNAQLASFGFMNRKEENGMANRSENRNGRRNGNGSGIIVQYSSNSDPATQPATILLASQRVSKQPTVEDVLNDLYEYGIMNEKFTRTPNTNVDDYIFRKISNNNHLSVLHDPVYNIASYTNNFEEFGFVNSSGSDCYRNSALHLLLTILKRGNIYIKQDLDRNVNGKYKQISDLINQINNDDLQTFLLNIINKRHNQSNVHRATPPYYVLSDIQINNNKQIFKPTSSNGRSTQQDTNEYLNELLKNFISLYVKSMLNVKTFNMKSMSDDDDEKFKPVMNRGFTPFIIIRLPEIIPGFMNQNGMGNPFKYSDHSMIDIEDIIERYLKINAVAIPENNQFIILELIGYTRERKKPFFLKSRHEYIYFKNNVYTVNDVIYHNGTDVKSGHYVCHSFRHTIETEKQWFVYDDTGVLPQGIPEKNIYMTPVKQNKTNSRYFFEPRSNWSPTTILMRRVPLPSQVVNKRQIPDRIYDPQLYYNLFTMYIMNINTYFQITDNKIVIKQNQTIDINQLDMLFGNSVIESPHSTPSQPIIDIKRSILYKYLYICAKYKNKNLNTNMNNAIRQIITNTYAQLLIQFLFRTSATDYNIAILNTKYGNSPNKNKFFKNRNLKLEYQTDSFIIFL